MHLKNDKYVAESNTIWNVTTKKKKEKESQWVVFCLCEYKPLSRHRFSSVFLICSLLLLTENFVTSLCLYWILQPISKFLSRRSRNSWISKSSNDFVNWRESWRWRSCQNEVRRILDWFPRKSATVQHPLSFLAANQRNKYVVRKSLGLYLGWNSK